MSKKIVLINEKQFFVREWYRNKVIFILQDHKNWSDCQYRVCLDWEGNIASKGWLRTHKRNGRCVINMKDIYEMSKWIIMNRNINHIKGGKNE